MNVFEIQQGVWFLIFVLLVVVKAVAFISSLLYPPQAYEATDKLTKTAWSVILGLGLAAQVVFSASVIGIINLVFTVAAGVYLADVRPALREVTPRR